MLASAPARKKLAKPLRTAAKEHVKHTAHGSRAAPPAPVVVAVIDGGVDVSHPDLQGKLWVNAGEVAGNGVDDDGDGFVDDVNGANLVSHDGNVADESGHGTHVAGIVSRYDPSVRIMALKAGHGEWIDIPAATQAVDDHGARCEPSRQAAGRLDRMRGMAAEIRDLAPGLWLQHHRRCGRAAAAAALPVTAVQPQARRRDAFELEFPARVGGRLRRVIPAEPDRQSDDDGLRAVLGDERRERRHPARAVGAGDRLQRCGDRAVRAPGRYGHEPAAGGGTGAGDPHQR